MGWRELGLEKMSSIGEKERIQKREHAENSVVVSDSDSHYTHPSTSPTVTFVYVMSLITDIPIINNINSLNHVHLSSLMSYIEKKAKKETKLYIKLKLMG